MTVPPAWAVPVQVLNADMTAAEYHIRLETDRVDGTDFPYGCRWCGRSLQRDGLDFCEALEGSVHADCHEESCISKLCSSLLCSEERCSFREECDGCFEAVCSRHTVSECLC
jgi:hypothetical protein